MTCPEHGVPFPCVVPIDGHFMLEDGDDGWYVVGPYGRGRWGPFTEDEGDVKVKEARTRYGYLGVFPGEVAGAARSSGGREAT